MPQDLPTTNERTHTNEAAAPQAPTDPQLERIKQAEEAGHATPIVLRDRATDDYYVGEINPKMRKVSVDKIGSRARINEWFREQRLSAPALIPTYDLQFDPANEAVFDAEATPQVVNRYTPSDYRRSATRTDEAEVPTSVARVIRHVLGEDSEAYERFLNWFAVIFRYGVRTETAWLLQGTQGTGKGLLYREILRPLIGSTYSREVALANLGDRFNAYQETTQLLFIDEVDTEQVRGSSSLMAKIKSWITEDTIALRGMRKDLREVPNHLNLILASNHVNAMWVEVGDRRFNVAPRQDNKLLGAGEDGSALVDQIRQELQAFADYLLSRDANRGLARTALDNEAKRLLQGVTQTPVEEVATALREGDLTYFVAMQPDTLAQSGAVRSRFDGGQLVLRDVYNEFLDAAQQAARDGRKHVISHQQLFGVFQLLAGGMPPTKTKLSRLLGEHRLAIAVHTVNGASVRGFGVHWDKGAQPQEAGEAELSDGTEQ